MISKYDKAFPSGDLGDTISGIADHMRSLNTHTKPYFQEHRAMLSGDTVFYKELLDGEDLPLEGSCPEDVISRLSVFFQRTVRWEKAETMINITPPANTLSIASVAYSSLFNPNFAQDEPSGCLMGTELAVISFLARMAGWDEKKAGGLFTFGGKGTNLYAGKMGLVKAVPGIRQNGVGHQPCVIVSNEKSHPCHVEVCDWLGLGRNACLTAPVQQNGTLDLEKLEALLSRELAAGTKVGCIIVNGGTTNEVIVDPIRAVVDLRDRLVKAYQLDYRPHVHVDSVIGWVWLAFRYYDFEKNELGMTAFEKHQISSLAQKISQVEYADSFGVDFHKTGFCPYISSCIMVRDRRDLHALGGKGMYDMDTLKIGEYSPFEWSLELTRSSGGPIAAYTAFRLFGIRGYQELIYSMFSNGCLMRNILSEEKEIDVINPNTEGFATLFVVLPPSVECRYLDYVRSGEPDVGRLLEYNHQFFLFLLDLFEKGELGFRITFSKSYRPYGSPHKTGCLKLYQSSPVAKPEDVRQIMNALIAHKHEFDRINPVFTETVNKPTDFVYRDN